MIIHWKYLKYVLRHKWFVFMACRRHKVPIWQALTHDLSKFRPSEWVPYARYFYGDTPIPMERWRWVLYQWAPWEDTVDGREATFNVAWLKHIHRNPHHWQHWLLQLDDGELKALPMPKKYADEMLADWEGAGRAIKGYDNLLFWYFENRHKQIMHPSTRTYVEDMIDIRYGLNIDKFGSDTDKWHEDFKAQRAKREADEAANA